MPEGVLARASDALARIDVPSPRIDDVRRRARRRTSRRAGTAAAAGVLLLLGIALPLLLLRGLGADGPRGVPAAGVSGTTGTTGLEPTGPRVSGPWPTGPGSDRVVFLPPFLRGDDRWFTFESDPAPAGEPTFVWASTIPIVESDLTYGAIIPPATIEALPPEGAVITIGAVTEVDPSGDPFPYPDLSLDLDRGMLRPPVAEEPGADDPDTRLRVIELSEGPVLVRVYFGTASPSEALIESAQRELDTLQLAPACPVPAEGPYGASLMADQGAPGDVLIVLGMNTFRREDGSYDTASVGSIVAWWNADPTDWPYLASFSTVTPSPAVAESPLIRLGADGVDTCGFAIDAVVPDVPPGDYPVVVISEGHGGASIRSVLTFHVVD